MSYYPQRSPAQRRAIAISYAKKAAASKYAAKAPAKRTYTRASTAKKPTIVRSRVPISKAAAYRKPVATKHRRPRVTGHGDYKKDYGSRLGSVVGEGIQELLSQINPLRTIFGLGDYYMPDFQIHGNTLLSMGNDPPEVYNAKDGRMILRHREYITDVITGPDSGFNLTSYKIQPGIDTTFPWLAQVAQAFEQYRLRGCIFEFKSNSADALNSTNTALGTVIMATEYDSTRPNFANKQEMENHQYAASAKQSCSMLHPIECAPDATSVVQLYVRPGAPPADADPRLYDFGNFQIATVGQQGASVNIGELWCTYEIELLKPMMNEPGALQQAAFFTNNSGVTASTLFGDFDTLQKSSVNNLEVELDVNVITFPKNTQGTYLLMYYVIGLGTADLTWPTVTLDGFEDAGPWEPQHGAPQQTDTANRMVVWQSVKSLGFSSSGSNPTITFGTGGLIPAGTAVMSLYISGIKDGMTQASLGPYDLDVGFIRLMEKQFVEKYRKKFQRDRERELLALEQGEKAEQEEAEEETPWEVNDLSHSTLQEIVSKARAKKAAAAEKE